MYIYIVIIISNLSNIYLPTLKSTADRGSSIIMISGSAYMALAKQMRDL